MSTITTKALITPLSQRMQHDMMLRGLGEHTQEDYIRHVRRFAVFLGRPPDTATSDDMRRYRLHQHEQAINPLDQTKAQIPIAQSQNTRGFLHGGLSYAHAPESLRLCRR